jgi:hypothetical protein
MLVSDIAPTEQFTGGIVLEQIMKSLECSRIDLRILVDAQIKDYRISKLSNYGDISWFAKPNENWTGIPKFLAKQGERFAKKESSAIASILLREISRNRPDHLIFVIQGQTSIRIAEELAKVGIPYTCIHWDPWRWWAKAHKIPKIFDLEISKSYGVVNASGFHLVPTDAFAAHYAIDKDRSLPLFPSMSEQVSSEVQKQGAVKIAFVGQYYAKKQIDYFLSRLDDLGWIIENRPIELHIFGKEKIFVGANFVNHGWLNYAALTTAISEYDFALLPYPEWEDAPDAFNTSFPSKLSTYISANLPILYVGPKGSSVESIIEQCGIELSHQFSERELFKAIQKLIANRTAFQEQGAMVYRHYFSKEAQSSLLAEWKSRNSIIDSYEKGRHFFVPKTIRSHVYIGISLKYYSIILRSLLVIQPRRVISLLRFGPINLVNKLLYKMIKLLKRLLLKNVAL